MDDPGWRRLIIALVLLGIAFVGYVSLGGWLWTAIAIVAVGILLSHWIVRGGNDMYRNRTE